MPFFGCMSNPKDAWDRFDFTMDAMDNVPQDANGPLGGGAQLVRNLITQKMNDPEMDQEDIGADLSIGSYYWIRTRFGRGSRHLRRILLLVYRVLAYHSKEEMLAYKPQAVNMNNQQVTDACRNWVRHGIQIHMAKNADNRQQFLNLTLPESNGRLIQGYAQGAGRAQDQIADWRDPRTTVLDFTRSGWCLGLSSVWLGYRTSLLHNFWTYARTDIAAAEFQGSYRRNRLGELFTDPRMRAEITRNDQMGWKQANQWEWAERKLREFGLQHQHTIDGPDLDDGQPPPSAQLADALVAAGGDFNLVDLSMRIGNHAIAAHRFANGILFMDPNIGEISFVPAGNLKSWLHKMVRHFNYDIYAFSVKKFGVNAGLPNRLRPPQPVQQLHEFQQVRLNLRRTNHNLW